MLKLHKDGDGTTKWSGDYEHTDYRKNLAYAEAFAKNYMDRQEIKERYPHLKALSVGISKADKSSKKAMIILGFRAISGSKYANPVIFNQSHIDFLHELKETFYFFRGMAYTFHKNSLKENFYGAEAIPNRGEKCDFCESFEWGD